MTISSRTPEGEPHLCPVCQKYSLVEPSHPTGDSCCPSCGQLLQWFQARAVSSALVHEAVLPETISLSTPLFYDSGVESLEFVEFIMELESEFDIQIPETEAEQITTIADAIRYIQEHRRK